MRTLHTSTVAVLVGAVGAGCAAQSPTYEKKLAELQDKVLILQNQRDQLEERLAAVELRQDSLLTQQQSAPERVSRPPLKVVVLEPSQSDAPESAGVENESPRAAASGAAAPTAPAQRPLISGEGNQLRVTEEKQ